MTNSVDPDQMPHFPASGSTLFVQACLFKYVGQVRTLDQKKKDSEGHARTNWIRSGGYEGRSGLSFLEKSIVSQQEIRGMFEMNCLLSSSSISTWGTIKTNTYLYRAIPYLHNGV